MYLILQRPNVLAKQSGFTFRKYFKQITINILIPNIFHDDLVRAPRGGE
jgi:hypothetical protein